jgi:hypothetical protein
MSHFIFHNFSLLFKRRQSFPSNGHLVPLAKVTLQCILAVKFLQTQHAAVFKPRCLMLHLVPFASVHTAEQLTAHTTLPFVQIVGNKVRLTGCVEKREPWPNC